MERPYHAKREMIKPQTELNAFSSAPHSQFFSTWEQESCRTTNGKTNLFQKVIFPLSVK